MRTRLALDGVWSQGVAARRCPAAGPEPPHWGVAGAIVGAICVLHLIGVLVPVHDRLAAIPGVAQGLGYSHAVITSGRLAFIAGQIGVDTDGQLVGPGDLAAQTRQALQNLQNVLGAVGADWSDVVRLGWYVTDIANLQTIRDIRDEFLRPALGDQPNPASTLIQVASLFRPELLVEVEAVVALPG
jgi:enamine deaminase RidA (YjgF/YER057c/UK114 family)